MAIFRGRYKKGNFRGIRKTGKIPFLGLWRLLAAGWSFFRTTKKEAKFQDLENKARISGPPKIGLFSGPKKTARKPRFLGPGNKAAF